MTVATSQVLQQVTEKGEEEQSRYIYGTYPSVEAMSEYQQHDIQQTI